MRDNRPFLGLLSHPIAPRLAVFNRLTRRRIAEDRRQSSKSQRRRRLQLEQLEIRLPLAAPSDLAIIEGRIFADVSGDGYTPGEEVSGATVNVYRDNGDSVFNRNVDTLMGSVTSGADGRYRIENLTAGDYFVEQPAQSVDGRELVASVSPAIEITAEDVIGQLFTVIDSFNAAPQLVFDDTGDGVPVTSSAQGPTTEIIGGERDLLVNKTSVNGRVQISVNDPLLPGFLSFDSIQTGQGRRLISWDGLDGDALVLDDAGLGDVDLTSSSAATGLRLEIGADSAAGNATIRIYTDDGVAGTATRFSTAVVAIPDTGGEASALEFVPFSAFVPTSGGGADFTRIGAIELEITGAANVNGAANLVGATGPTSRSFDFANFSTADLSLAMAASTTAPAIGQNVTFTITATNDGPDDATGVTVQNRLPAGLAYVSSAPSQGTYDSATGNWTVGTIPSDGTAVLTVIATVETVGALTATAEIMAADRFDPDSTPGNNQPSEDDQASVTLSSELADLSLTKTVDNAAPDLGDEVTFTITVSNAGPSTATGISVSDVLPEGLTLISAEPSQGTIAGGIWTVGTLAGEAAATLTTTVRVDAVGSIVNTAELLTADQPDPDSTPGNNVPGEDDQASVTLMIASADLALTKTVSNTTPNVGSDVTFTISVRNDGPNAATGVTVRDALPDGLTFVSAMPAADYDPATGIWTIGAIAPEETVTLAVVATAAAAGSLSNTAEVLTSDQPDPDSTPGNNVEDEDDQATLVIIAQQADLSLTKTVDDASPNRGQVVAFTITLANAGPSTATGVQVRDQLPAGLNLQAATPTVGTFDESTGIWSVPTLAAGSEATLTLTALVDTDAAVTNTAEVIAADQPDPDSTPGNNDPAEDDQASITLTAQAADLSLTQQVDNAAPDVGDTVRFTVTVANAGPDDATSVAVEQLLPAGLTFVSSSPSQGTYTADSGQWTVGTIAAGTEATLELLARVDSAAATTVTARITQADQADPDSTPGNNEEAEDDQQSVVVTPQVIDLALEMNVDQSRPVVGQNVTFTLTLTNAGPNAATAIAVRDQLPTGLSFVSSAADVGSYSEATGLWTLESLAPGATAALQLVARYDQPLALTNTAEVVAVDQFDADSTPGNNLPDEDDQDAVTLEPATADLSLTKTVSNATPNLGESVTFTITVSNAGPDAATGVSILDALPAGLAFVSATPSAGTYSAATGVWTIGELASGGDASLQLAVTPTGATELTNTAEVLTADQFDPDSTPGNNVPGEDDQAVVIISPQLIDLSLTKTISNATPNIGENVTFVLTLANAGPSTATDIQVLDQLPAGVTFVSSTTASGQFDSATGIWTPQPVAAGTTATLTIIARVAEAGLTTNTAEVIAAGQPDVDSTPGNGDPTEDDFALVSFNTPVADLSLTQTVDNPSPNRNELVTFTIIVTNNGPDDASGIVVASPIPTNFSFAGSSATTGVFTPTTGRWTIPELASGETATLTVSGRATNSTPVVSTSEIVEADQVDPNSTPGNADPTEDDFARVVVTPNVIDLSVTGTIDNLAPQVGDVVTLTFTVNNTGPATATGVALALNIPPGVTPLFNGATQGMFDPASGLWIVGSLAPLQTETLSVQYRVDAAGIKLATMQVTAADQFDLDSTPANNDPDEDDQVTVVIKAPRIFGLRMFLAR